MKYFIVVLMSMYFATEMAKVLKQYLFLTDQLEE